MNLADAYPNSALPVGALLAISLTMAIVLAVWLIMVFRADSQPRVAAPEATSEDKHNGTGQAEADRREGVSA